MKTASEAATELARQGHLNNELAHMGIPGILPVQVIEKDDKTYLVRDKLDMPDKLNQEQLGQVRQSIDALHKAGYVVGDDIQVGLKDGKAYQFDLGKAHKSKDETKLEEDSDAFERFSTKMGQPALPSSGNGREAPVRT